MNQQTVERIAYAHSSALGIGDDALAHLQVAILVEVTMYHAGSGFDNRNFGSITDEVDKLLSSTRNAEVNIAHGIQHFAGSFMGSREECNNIRINTKSYQHPVDKFDTR